MSREEHWQRVYGAKRATEVSWHALHLERSIAEIQAVATRSAQIIDIGGGASTLVDDLLALGYANLTVLDVSTKALVVAKERLGGRAKEVTWIAGDVTKSTLPSGLYDVWHDRAVFHFLTQPEDRKAYAEFAARSLKAGAHAILATFALDGPTRCSGLDVVRYDAEALARELGPAFALKSQSRETHRTPSGAQQQFLRCVFERIP